MRYRALSASGDYTFGQGQSNFLINSPEAVAQAVSTRLRLLTGEWFLDSREGTPYATEVLGKNTQPFYDQAIRDRILGTDGCTAIVAYTSSLNEGERALTIEATILTAFSATPVPLPLVTIT